jgi:hypothetical protein
VEPLTETQLRDSFINCSKGERARIALPRTVAFEDLDFLGWRDPKAPDRGYLVTWLDGRPVGIALRAATRGAKSLTRSTMCSMCMTPHTSSGVTLFTAAVAGRGGDSVGNYMCANLQCSRYLRGSLKSEAIVDMAETLDLASRVERLETRMAAFVARVART